MPWQLVLNVHPPGAAHRKRELEGLRAKVLKQLEAGWQEAAKRVQDSCGQLLDASAKFGREKLRTFEQGGKYAEESAALHRWGGLLCRSGEMCCRHLPQGCSPSRAPGLDLGER